MAKFVSKFLPKLIKKIDTNVFINSCFNLRFDASVCIFLTKWFCREKCFSTKLELVRSGGWQGCQMVCFQTKKFQICVNFGGPLTGKCWYILWPFGIFYGHLLLFMAVWYSLCSFVTFFPIWNGPRKIWQPWLLGELKRLLEADDSKSRHDAALPDVHRSSVLPTWPGVLRRRIWIFDFMFFCVLKKSCWR
jgi:hypothetical protein